MSSRTLVPQRHSLDLNLSNAIYVHQAMKPDQIQEFANLAMQLYVRQLFTDAYVEKMSIFVLENIEACEIGRYGRVRDLDFTLDDCSIVQPAEKALLKSQEAYGEEDFCGYRRVVSNVHKKMLLQTFKCNGKRFKLVKRRGTLYVNQITKD